MSGGSFDYLYSKSMRGELGTAEQYERAADALRARGHTVAADQVTALAGALRTLLLVADVLSPVLYAIEWRESDDWGDDQLEAAVAEWAHLLGTLERGGH